MTPDRAGNVQTVERRVGCPAAGDDRRLTTPFAAP